MLKMTALEPDDTVNAVDKMTPTEMGLLCALLGNNVIRAQTLYLSGLSLPQFTHWCRVSTRGQKSHSFLCYGVQAVRLEMLALRNSARR